MRTPNNTIDTLLSEARPIIEGRKALEQAMAEPIKIALEYKAIGSKLLQVDELPSGALSRYERDTLIVRGINRIADPLVDFEDYTSEEFWPEWEIVGWDGDRKIVRALTASEATQIFIENRGTVPI